MKTGDELRAELNERREVKKKRKLKANRTPRVRRRACDVCGEHMYNVHASQIYCSKTCRDKAANTRQLAKKHEEHFNRPLSEMSFKEIEKILIKGGVRKGSYKQALGNYMDMLLLKSFEEKGPAIIEKLAEESPKDYISVCLSRLPKEQTVAVEHSIVNILEAANKPVIIEGEIIEEKVIN